MDKDIRSELTKIATEILLLKDNVEIELLLEKVRDLYEKIIVLKNLPDDHEELLEELNTREIIEKVEPIVEESIVDNSVSEKIEEELQNENINEIPEVVDAKIEIKEEPKEHIEKEPEKAPASLNDLFVPTFDSIKDDMSQKAEFKDTVSLEETEKMFETKKGDSQQLSLNDKLVNSSIQIGLNDRIAFVNKLFNFSQSEFNNVLSRLNTFNNKQEALNYIQYQVKPNYNWTGVEDLEERLIFIIERKFL